MSIFIKKTAIFYTNDFSIACKNKLEAAPPFSFHTIYAFNYILNGTIYKGKGFCLVRSPPYTLTILVAKIEEKLTKAELDFVNLLQAKRSFEK